MRLVTRIALSSVLVLAGIAGSANSANAATGYCVGPPTQTDGLSVTNVTFRGGNADDCYGIVVDETPSSAEIAARFAAAAGENAFLQFSNGQNASVGNGLDMQFLLTPLNVNSGTWTLNFTDVAGPAALPVTWDLVLALGNVLPGSSPVNNQWAYYFFNHENITEDPSNGTWAFNYQGQTMDKAYLFVRNSTPAGTGGGSQQAVIPEPASLLLLGSGLSAAAWRARRRKQAK